MLATRLDLDAKDRAALKYLKDKNGISTNSEALRYALRKMTRSKKDERLLELARDVPNVLLTVRGRTQTVRAWAQEVGLSHQTIDNRLRSGWTPEDAVLLPLGERPVTKTAYVKRTRKPSKTTPLGVRLAECDVERVESIRSRWGLPSFQSAVRFALRGRALVESGK